MIRYTLFTIAILATAATAFAAVHPELSAVTGVGANMTVIEKTSPFPVLGPIVVETCAVEDCSDTLI